MPTTEPSHLTAAALDELESWLDAHTIPGDPTLLPRAPLGSLWSTIVRQLIATARESARVAFESGRSVEALAAALAVAEGEAGFDDDDALDHAVPARSLERAAEALESLSLIAAQVLANGSPVVNAIRSLVGESETRTNLDAEGEPVDPLEYGPAEVAAAKARALPLSVRKSRELRDLCLARGVDPNRATFRLERDPVEGVFALHVDGPALDRDDGRF